MSQQQPDENSDEENEERPLKRKGRYKSQQQSDDKESGEQRRGGRGGRGRQGGKPTKGKRRIVDIAVSAVNPESLVFSLKFVKTQNIRPLKKFNFLPVVIERNYALIRHKKEGNLPMYDEAQHKGDPIFDTAAFFPYQQFLFVSTDGPFFGVL